MKYPELIIVDKERTIKKVTGGVVEGGGGWGGGGERGRIACLQANDRPGEKKARNV